jgi:hypothetical protein
MPLSKTSITTEKVEQAPIETAEQHVEVTQTPTETVTKTETEVPAHTDVVIDKVPNP